MDYYVNSALRLRLFFDQPNHLAVALVMAWGVCLYLLKGACKPAEVSREGAKARRGKLSFLRVFVPSCEIYSVAKSVVLSIVIIASMVGLAVTFSRSGLVALFVVGCVLWRSRETHRWIVLSLVVMTICFLVIPEVGGRFASIEPFADKSISHRFDVWRGTLAMSHEKPWTGFGARSFGETLSTWHLPDGASHANTRYVTAVNAPMTFLGYWGYPALFGYICAWFLLLFSGFRGLLSVEKAEADRRDFRGGLGETALPDDSPNHLGNNKAIVACFIVQLAFLVGGLFTHLHQSRILHIVLLVSICGTILFHRNDAQAWRLLWRRWLPIAATVSVVVCGVLVAAGLWVFSEGYALRGFPMDTQGKSTGQGWALVPDKPNGSRLVWFIPHGAVREHARLLCRPLAKRGWEVVILEAGKGEILRPEVAAAALKGSTGIPACVNLRDSQEIRHRQECLCYPPHYIQHRQECLCYLVIGGIGEEGLAALAVAAKVAGASCSHAGEQDAPATLKIVAVNIESYWPFAEFNPQNTIKTVGGQVTLAYESASSRYAEAASALAGMGRKNGKQVDLLPLDAPEGKGILSVLRVKYFEPFSPKKSHKSQK